MTKKKLTESEPAWKRRQKELHKELRMASIKKAVFIALGVLALGFLIWSTGRGLVTPQRKSKSKGPLAYAIARVADMKPVSNHGKPAVMVRFKTDNFTVETTVDKKSAEKLNRSKEYSISYYTDRYTGERELHKWDPIDGDKVE